VNAACRQGFMNERGRKKRYHERKGWVCPILQNKQAAQIQGGIAKGENRSSLPGSSAKGTESIIIKVGVNGILKRKSGVTPKLLETGGASVQGIVEKKET